MVKKEIPPEPQYNGGLLNIKLGSAGELAIKMLMQFGAVGVISILLIMGFNNFYEAHKESVQMYREELKEFRYQLDKQRQHDVEMRKMSFEGMKMLADKLEKQVQTIDYMAKEFRIYAEFIKGKSKCN